MGKSQFSTGDLQALAKIVSFHKPKPKKSQLIIPFKSREVGPIDTDQLKVKKMEESSSSSLILDGKNRLPLSNVVSDCVRRWFQDTLKEAKAGDISMQVLVGQMYFNGYGIPKDSQKGRAWINRASKSRVSAWKVSDKRPGYAASDSDSDEGKDDADNNR
ncbi:uncharacterized protein LOC8259499 isoform X1 [Ricinus communis]|uniref:Sel1 repeat-containing protein n=1 Tax=Ricinus communis TaxID=3988 RepID=B9S496_RICCO|nr:uncharacterized protein LOC8259499 isoform X1 [Ricinus communis]EEF41524.1 conserved hypothetical protein [Ricinus communis]|eukprot:XP_002520815.1 uncharacterized protein LOC8259499 [Ricinus communis]